MRPAADYPCFVEAETVLMDAARAYEAALGHRLVAAYALGSLAHGGFSPLVSDIDLGLIVSDPVCAEDAEAIEAVAEAERATSSTLSARLSVFWGTRSTLTGEADGGRFPALDRLDLIENGRLLLGTDARDGIPRPGTDELLVTGAEFALELLTGRRAGAGASAGHLGSRRSAGEDAVEEIRCPELLIAQGVRRLTKLVLYPVRFLFTATSGRIGTNEDAAAWYARQDGVPSAALVAAALGWRTAAPRGSQATCTLLRDQIVPLYLHYLDDHVARLDAVGQVDLAQAFAQLRNRIRE